MDDKQIINLYLDGISVKAISKIIKKSRSFIKKILKANNIKIRTLKQSVSKILNEDGSIKLCSKTHGCGEIKTIDNFYKSGKYKNGNYIKYSFICKECESRRKKLKKSLKLKVKKQKEIDPLLIQELKKCTRCLFIKNINDFYFIKSLNKFKNPCKSCRAKTRKNHYNKNKNKILSSNKQWKIKNKKRYNDTSNKYNKSKRKNDKSFKLKKNISCYLRSSLFYNKKMSTSSFLNYFNYTIDELKLHLESQFEPWMTWENYGAYKGGDDRKWNIDHIIPQSAFIFNDNNYLESTKYLWSLNNLRPMEASENYKKSNKVTKEAVNLIKNDFLIKKYIHYEFLIKCNFEK